MKKQAIRLLGLGLFISILSINLVSCKDDDKPPVVTNDDDNTNPDPLSGKDYLLFEGVKVEFRNPAMGSLKTSAVDSSLEWRGNKPESATGDTVIFIKHGTTTLQGDALKRREGIHGFAPWPQPFTSDDVTIRILWGTIDGRPRVDLTGGTYELKRVDGKWVSILKNGTGTWTKSNGDKVNYTGIELKATWPN